MENNKQTWWDEDIKSQFNSFKSWVGNSNAQTKVMMRDFIIKEGYETIVDFGCGMCDDYYEYMKIPIIWQGVESSTFLYKNALEGLIPVKNVEAHNTGFPDNVVQVSYSRHVLEHQRHFEPILTEMVRVASKMVVHIFFITPKNDEIINYDKKQNLYHNTFSKPAIEELLNNNDKVASIEWLPLNKTETSLIVLLK